MADDNNTVDLTENEGAGGKKAAKAAKPPKEKKPAKQKVEKEPAPKKEKSEVGKKKGGAGGIIFLIILLILVAGFVYEELEFNMLGTRDIFVETVIRLDPDFVTLEERRAKVDIREADLDKREKTLDSREQQLQAMQEELQQYEEELTERSVRLTPVYRQPMNEQDLEDMDSLSKTYSQMAPENAAAILASLYDMQDIAAILYFMTERSAAGILSAMDVRLAADLTEILLYK